MDQLYDSLKRTEQSHSQLALLIEKAGELKGIRFLNLKAKIKQITLKHPL